jgi:glycosyltransferase involved in cell wall biosynthesis
MPHSTTSVEGLVWLLTEELVRRGHQVTLCATGDSQTSAALHAIYQRGYDDDPDLWNWQFHETMHVSSVFERAADFDVIHNHAYHFALPFARLTGTPVVHTYHTMPDDDIRRAFVRQSKVNVVALSNYQRQAYEGLANVAVVPHGIDAGAFPYSPVGGDYLLFLGRMISGKGALEAIALATKAGRRLVLAGPDDGDSEYFRSRIAPLVDGRQVQYVGPVGIGERNRLLAGTAALLYPIVDPEPFGLVLIEAMACGTPVLGHGIGAVPEVIENGVTGYMAPDLESLARCIPNVLALDRQRIRQIAVARFGYRRMTDDYEAVYRAVLGGRNVSSFSARPSERCLV